MLIEERHRRILEMLAEKGSVTAPQIQRKFGVGYSSATRDLRILGEQGLLHLTRGGALPLEQVAAGKPAGVTCRDINEVKPNYMAVAMKAVSMIRENDVIFITSATVGWFIAQKLPDIKLRAVVNSTVIADELRGKQNITVIMLGGEMDGKGNCYDAFAVEMLKRLRFDRCFITSAAITPEFGMSIQKSQAIAFWGAVMDSSREVVGLYPSEKIGVDSVVSIEPASRLDILITDSGILPETAAAFEEAGVEVVVTGAEAQADGETETTCTVLSENENETSNPANINP